MNQMPTDRNMKIDGSIISHDRDLNRTKKEATALTN